MVENSVEKQKEMVEAFKALDKDGTGSIAESEIRQLMSIDLKPEDVDEIMKSVTVKDGMVEIEGLVKLLATGKQE